MRFPSRNSLSCQSQPQSHKPAARCVRRRPLGPLQQAQRVVGPVCRSSAARGTAPVLVRRVVAYPKPAMPEGQRGRISHHSWRSGPVGTSDPHNQPVLWARPACRQQGLAKRPMGLSAKRCSQEIGGPRKQLTSKRGMGHRVFLVYPYITERQGNSKDFLPTGTRFPSSLASKGPAAPPCVFRVVTD
jgi:hypothetical protein